MSYFESYGNIVYDQRSITNITKRVSFLQSIKDNPDLTFEYQISDGETPESIAYDFYGDASLEWVILMMNDIIDPFYGWSLDREQMENYLISKYGALTESQTGYGAVHHWEFGGVNFLEVKTTQSVAITSGGTTYTIGDLLSPDWACPESPVIEVTSVAGGVIDGVTIVEPGIFANSPAHALTMTGGTGTGATLTFTLTVPSNAVAVSNQEYEEAINDERRKIKVLYSEFLPKLVDELEYLVS